MQTDFIDRTSGVPVYRQLADHIKKQCKSGYYKPGDLLPSESDYIRNYNISRTTVRQALGLIAAAGLIKRERGRGTMVIPQIRVELPYLLSFTEEAHHSGQNPSAVLLSRSEETITINAAAELDLPVNARVLKIERLRILDKEPIGLSISWLNVFRFPRLLELDFSAPSIYALFEDGLGLTIRSARDNIHAGLADDREAQKLQIKPRSPVLRRMRTTYIQGEADSSIPIEYVEAVFNGHSYSVDVALYRQSSI